MHLYNSFTIYSWILIATSLLLVSLAHKTTQKRSHITSILFAWLMASEAIYSFGYAMELASIDIEQVKFWINIQFLGASFIPAFVILGSYSYINHVNAPFRIYFILLFLSSLTLIIDLTNDFHNLIIKDLIIQHIDNLTISNYSFGPWYYFHFLYNLIALLISVYLYVINWSLAPKKQRIRSSFILLGSLIPWVFYMGFFFNIAPYGMDTSPFGFVFSALFYFYGLSKFRFNTVIPIARERVLENLQDAVLIFSNDGVLVDFNNAATKIIPTLNSNSCGETIKNLKLDHLLDKKHDLSQKFTSDDCHYEISTSLLFNSTDKEIGYALVFRDMTENYNLLDQLRHFAETDELTRIFNRRAILEKLDSILASNEILGVYVALFDIDNFKSINDQGGHHSGDHILKETVNLTKKLLLEHSYLGRYGGDEFLIIFKNTTQQKCLDLVNTINITCQEYLKISLSIGLTSLTEYDSIHSILQRGDVGLYKSKEKGKAQTTYIQPTSHQ